MAPIRRIELPGGDIGIERFIAECELGREHFGELPIRTMDPRSPHREASDVLLRYIPNIELLLPESQLSGAQRLTYYQWASMTHARETRSVARHFPLCMLAAMELQKHLSAEELGSVVLAKLPPGGEIFPHSDRQPAIEATAPVPMVPPALWFDRYQLIIQGQQMLWVEPENSYAEGAWILAGSLWWFDNAQRHYVINTGDVDRIALIVDLHSHTRPMRRS